MADVLNGVWKFKSSENFDKYMESIGVNFASRKMGNLAKPTVTIKINGNSFSLKSESTFKNFETVCTLGEEFDEETPDGRKCTSVISWNGEKLVHAQNWNGKETSITRYLNGSGDLAMDCEFEGIISKRVYSKA